MTEFDFSHNAERKVTADMRAEYTLYDLRDRPVLTLAPATGDNKVFSNAQLKATAGRRNLRAAGNLTVEDIDESRQIDRPLYAQYIVKGWKNVKTRDGEEVPFNVEACEQFINALPNHIFDNLRIFAANANNFLNIDVEGVAKN